MAAGDFYRIVTAAITDFARHGYDSEARLADWLIRIRTAAGLSLSPPGVVEKAAAAALHNVFMRTVDRGGLERSGVPRFTVERLRPQLRAELDRRIAASANLIRLNREQAIETTLRRFSGWATSIPAGGSKVVEKSEEAKAVRKSMASLPYRERVVAIDQGHKLASAINDITAIDGGALAMKWHSRWRTPGYDYREDHKERDEQIYLIRGNWAQAKGLIKAGPVGYYDQITKPGEEVMCRCTGQPLFQLRQLPDDMLTEKGRDAVTRKPVAA